MAEIFGHSAVNEDQKSKLEFLPDYPVELSSCETERKISGMENTKPAKCVHGLVNPEYCTVCQTVITDSIEPASPSLITLDLAKINRRLVKESEPETEFEEYEERFAS